MPSALETSQAAEVMDGEQIADSIYLTRLEAADTVGEVRSELGRVINEVGAGNEIGERLTEIQEGLNEATESGAHDGVKLEADLGKGVLGQHTFDSGEAKVIKDQFTPEQVINNTRDTLAVVVEENKEGVGHPGQDPKARANVIYQGKPRVVSTALEGEVGKNIQKDIGVVRTDAPQEIYKEGEEMVEDLGAEKVSSYVRKGGAHQGEHMQALVWEQNEGISFDQMLQEGAQVGMSQEEIIEVAKKQGKLPAGMEMALSA